MAKMSILDEPLPNVYLLELPCHPDHRGSFTKIFHREAFAKQGLDFCPAEMFVTQSNAGVLRGMHFQVGPAAHDKLVTCTRGRVLDVVVDVRPESPTFNRPYAVELSHASHQALMIGKGYAHGFLALDDDSSMLYATTTVHEPSLDSGVLWSSINFQWPIQSPILSARDQLHDPICI